MREPANVVNRFIGVAAPNGCVGIEVFFVADDGNMRPGQGKGVRRSSRGRTRPSAAGFPKSAYFYQPAVVVCPRLAIEWALSRIHRSD